MDKIKSTTVNWLDSYKIKLAICALKNRIPIGLNN